MADKKKKRIRAIMAKTGMSHAAVANQMRQNNDRPVDEIEPRDAAPHAQVATSRVRSSAAMAAELRAKHLWEIQVGRLPTGQIFSGPTPSSFRNPDPERTHFAFGEHVRMAVSKAEHDQLANDGATVLHNTGSRSLQSVRIGRPTYALGCSVQCATCRRWLWAGAELRGACICGQQYQVTFEGEPDFELPIGHRCMDCGCESALTEPHEGRNPWRPVSEVQAVCRLCWRASYDGDPNAHVVRMATSQHRATLQARRQYASATIPRS